MKHGAPPAIVDPRDASSEYPQCDSKIIEIEYRRLRCPDADSKTNRDIVKKLSTRKKAVKILDISGGVFSHLNCPLNGRCKPE